MQYRTPFIAYPTTHDLQVAVRQLLESLQARTKVSQAETATRLIQGAASQLIDTFFTELLAALSRAEARPAYREAEAMVREINEKLTHYLGWASSFFSNDRIRPAVEHYQSLMTQIADGTAVVPHIAITISDELAARADQVLARLAQGQATAQEGIEVLIEVIDVALEALLVTPKKLMKFNFVVDKTLSGVISVTQSLAYRSLRKLGEHMPAEHQHILAAHLDRFLFSASEAQAA